MGETWCLFWEWSSLATVISGAPSTSFAESGTSAFPGLGALLSTFPVVGFGNGAILVVWVSFNVGSPVLFPELVSVVVVLSVGWDDFVTESNWLVWDSWDHNILDVVWVMVVVSGGDSSGKGDDGKFHFLLKSDYLNYFQDA
jgi:hypothetical protein